MRMSFRWPALIVALAVASILPFVDVPADAAPPAPPPQRCAGLKGQQVAGASVTAAVVNTSGEFTVPEDQGGPGEDQPGKVITGLPSYCAVELARNAVHILVWLPLGSWNGRFEGVGGGGFVVGFSYRALSEALEGGYAAATTDTGHPASQASGQFALDSTGHLDRRAIDDFAYRAIHEMTVTGKDVTTRFYGVVAEHAYFDGCSTGGRQALTEAQRYPHDYNGIVAGSPAVDFDAMAPGQLWPVFVQQRAGHQVAGCKLEAFYQASVAKCDALDGLTDGLVGDVDGCRFDPRTLIGRSTPCGVITAADAQVVAEILRGPHTGAGRSLWYGLEPGSDFKVLAGNPLYIAEGWYKYWLAQDPAFDWTTMSTADYVRLYRQGGRQFGVLAGDDPDLTSFRDGGGKLLIWTGLADPLIPPQGAVHYYDSVVRRMGGQDRTGSFARLFLAPGVGHCGGPAGTVGPVPSDPLQVVAGWVEHGISPASIEAVQAGGGRTRPLCAYPKLARYLGHGDPDSAASFYCG